MPELDIVPMRYCESGHKPHSWKVPSASGPGEYDVSYSTYRPDNPWHCNCLGFLYRRHCSHVKRKTAEMCFWSELVGGKAKGDMCPRCGGPTVIIMTGV